MKIRISLFFFLISLLPFIASNAQPVKSNRDPELCTGIAKKIVSLFEQGNYSSITTYFDDRLGKGLTSSKLQTSWQEMVDQLGPFKGIQESRTEMFVGATIIYCVCRFGDRLVDFKTVFNGAGKISGLFFLPYIEKNNPDSDSIHN